MSATLDSDDELDHIIFDCTSATGKRLPAYFTENKRGQKMFCGVDIEYDRLKAALTAWKAKGERRARIDELQRISVLYFGEADPPEVYVRDDAKGDMRLHERIEALIHHIPEDPEGSASHGERP